MPDEEVGDVEDVGDVDDPPRTKRSAAVLVPVLVVVAVVGFIVVVLATREPAANRVVSSPLVGRPAPELAGTTLDGDDLELTDERGSFVLVNFFATWCVPCVQEHDDLNRFAERHAALGDATVVSVVYDDDADAARAFFDERGGDWPVVVGDQGDIALDYSVTGVPESVLVAPDGTVLAKIVGGVTDDGLEDLLARFTGPAG